MADHLQDGRPERVTRRRLCGEDEIAEGGGRGFRLVVGSETVAVFVVRKDGVLAAYRNSCPHVGSPLDWRPDHFFDVTGAYLLCATHGALFRPADGYCIRGPCAGKSLAAVPITVEGGEIFLVEAERWTA